MNSYSGDPASRQTLANEAFEQVVIVYRDRLFRDNLTAFQTRRCTTTMLRTGGWLPFLNTYRTMCVAPGNDFRRLLEEVSTLCGKADQAEL